jgi:hypothetical protein
LFVLVCASGVGYLADGMYRGIVVDNIIFVSSIMVFAALVWLVSILVESKGLKM